MITEREKSAGRTTNHESKLPNGKPMTREDIIRMARQAGVYLAHTELTLIAGLERFAKLVAAHEREECAKLCDDQKRFDARWNMACLRLSKYIRARGEE
jgi:hypothetical protein